MESMIPYLEDRLGHRIRTMEPVIKCPYPPLDALPGDYLDLPINLT